ncbi:MAG: DUF1934 domain-containing protein [Oscillospiraceae bacterium]|nr:DUF1934 domain-containing protein [Oscillospiraceae bacterium]
MEALISIKGTQTYEDQEPEHMELVTEGTYDFQKNRIRIGYEETEMTGMEGVTTTFEIRPDSVTLQRSGAVISKMVFRNGERMDSLYDMGFGALLMTVCGKKIAAELGKEGGKLELEYDIEVEHAAKGTNRYLIEVHPKKTVQ